MVGCGHDATPRRQQVQSPQRITSTEATPLNASADRGHPVPILESDHRQAFDVGMVSVRTPGAGVWWYAIELGPTRDGFAGHIRIGASDDEVKLFLVRAGFETAGTPAIELPDDGSRNLLIRAETDRARAFEIGSTRTWRAVAPSEKPRSEHLRCELNKPDFTNPNCCRARCMFGAKQCTSVVSKVPRGHSMLVEISIGADQEIMAGARVAISADRTFVASGTVLAVDDHTSVVSLDKLSDPSKLAGASVLLDAPRECLR